MNPLRPYHYLNVLSIDVALGAVVMQMMVARFLHLGNHLILNAALFLAVWIIYTIDHLWDAHKSPQQAVTLRHHWHQQNFNVLRWVTLLTGLLGVLFLFFMPAKTVYWGAIMLVAVACYFLSIHFLSLKLPKEVFIAGIYAIGVCLGPTSLLAPPIPVMLYLVVLQIATLAGLNLCIFAWYERKSDPNHPHVNICDTIGINGVTKTIWALFIMLWLLGTVLMAFHFQDGVILSTEVVLMAMSTILLILFVRPDWFAKNDLYRMVGDGIFFLPIILLW